MLNTKIVQWKSLLTAVWTDPIWNLKSAVLCARLKQSRGYSWAPCAVSSSLQLSGDGQAERRSAEKKGERDKSKYLPLLFLLSLCNLLFNYFCLSGCSTRSHCQSIGATGKMWKEVFKAFCKFHGELWTFLFFFSIKMPQERCHFSRHQLGTWTASPPQWNKSCDCRGSDAAELRPVICSKFLICITYKCVEELLFFFLSWKSYWSLKGDKKKQLEKIVTSTSCNYAVGANIYLYVCVCLCVFICAKKKTNS